LERGLGNSLLYVNKKRWQLGLEERKGDSKRDKVVRSEDEVRHRVGKSTKKGQSGAREKGVNLSAGKKRLQRLEPRAGKRLGERRAASRLGKEGRGKEA